MVRIVLDNGPVKTENGTYVGFRPAGAVVVAE
jgi:hypothetical protein